MPTATAEIVNRRGAINYLESLRGVIENTRTSEFETLRAGLAAVDLNDADVITGIGDAADHLGGVVTIIDAILERLTGAHGAVAEAVATAGSDNVARDRKFYDEP